MGTSKSSLVVYPVTLDFMRPVLFEKRKQLDGDHFGTELGGSLSLSRNKLNPREEARQLSMEAVRQKAGEQRRSHQVKAGSSKRKEKTG